MTSTIRGGVAGSVRHPAQVGARAAVARLLKLRVFEGEHTAAGVTTLKLASARGYHSALRHGMSKVEFAGWLSLPLGIAHRISAKCRFTRYGSTHGIVPFHVEEWLRGYSNPIGGIAYIKFPEIVFRYATHTRLFELLIDERLRDEGVVVVERVMSGWVFLVQQSYLSRLEAYVVEYAPLESLARDLGLPTSVLSELAEMGAAGNVDLTMLRSRSMFPRAVAAALAGRYAMLEQFAKEWKVSLAVLSDEVHRRELKPLKLFCNGEVALYSVAQLRKAAMSLQA